MTSILKTHCTRCGVLLEEGEQCSTSISTVFSTLGAFPGEFKVCLECAEHVGSAMVRCVFGPALGVEIENRCEAVQARTGEQDDLPEKEVTAIYDLATRHVAAKAKKGN